MRINKIITDQLKKRLIVKQILLFSTLENVWKRVWRICILMLGCEELKKMFRRESYKNMSYHKFKTYFDFFELKNIDYS